MIFLMIGSMFYADELSPVKAWARYRPSADPNPDLLMPISGRPALSSPSAKNRGLLHRIIKDRSVLCRAHMKFVEDLAHKVRCCHQGQSFRWHDGKGQDRPQGHRSFIWGTRA